MQPKNFGGKEADKLLCDARLVFVQIYVFYTFFFFSTFVTMFVGRDTKGQGSKFVFLNPEGDQCLNQQLWLYLLDFLLKAGSGFSPPQCAA